MADPVVQVDIRDLTKEVKTLVQSYSGSDPRLYQAIMMLANQVDSVTQAIVPIMTIIGVAPTISLPPPTPANFGYILLGGGAIRLSWDRPAAGASISFEIRSGEAWDTATFITRTQSTVADVVPLPGQSNTFLLKSIDFNGVYSVEAASIVVVVAPPEPVGIEGLVIDNNVLLKWTPAISTFAIDYYEIFRGSISTGRVKSTFVTFFEILAGEYTYSIIPVDVIGNRGLPSQVTLVVNQPPDYVLTSSIRSAYQGTRTRVLLVNDPLLVTE